MKTIKFIIPLLTLLILSSCKTKNTSKLSLEKEVKIKGNSIIENKELILTETTFGKFSLKKGMILDESEIQKSFDNFDISKDIAEQDGLDYYIYKIGNEAVLATTDTKNNTLSKFWIQEESNISDEYGIKLGMTYNDVFKRRSNINISTVHYHIYLHKTGSNIAYEMSLGNYNGPDKEAYSLEEIKNNNSKVIRIIWK